MHDPKLLTFLDYIVNLFFWGGGGLYDHLIIDVKFFHNKYKFIQALKNLVLDLLLNSWLSVFYIIWEVDWLRNITFKIQLLKMGFILKLPKSKFFWGSKDML